MPKIQQMIKSGEGIRQLKDWMLINLHLLYSLYKVVWWIPNLIVIAYEKTEAVVQRCSVKKVFLAISQNSQENNCARVFFLIKLQA